MAHDHETHTRHETTATKDAPHGHGADGDHTGHDPAQFQRKFWLSLALFFFGMAGLGVTMWPFVVPPGLTIWDAAAPERSQMFMLVGVAITMPLIIAYTAWAYWVFRGKVADEGYH